MFNVGSVQGYLKLNTTGWNTGMRSAGMQLQSLSRTMMRFGALAVGSILLIEREFGKFDKAIRHATSVSETTEAQFKQMSEMALDASVQWNKAAADTAQAFYYLGSAGLTVTEQMQAFNDTIMLSRAMGSELSRTVEGMVDIVRAFNLEFIDSREIVDQLTKTIISSNQHFEDLDKALAYASSTAAMTNNTLAETNAMLGIMANAGIKGSMAGTVLRRAMTNLMSPTGEMAELIHQLGVNIYDTSGSMKPFIDIIGQISDKLTGTSERYRNMVFEVLFGRRAIAGQIQLFNYGSAALRRYANEIQNSAGTAERVAGKQMKAFTERLGQMWQEVRRVAIELGELLAPAIERVSDRIRYNLGVFRDYVKANSEAVLETMKWVTAIGAAALIFPPLLLIITGLTNQFVQLALAIGKAGIALATNPLTWLVAALYTLRVALATDFWEKAWENTIKPFFQNFGNMAFDTISQIMWEISLIPEGLNKAFSAEGVWSGIQYFMKGLQQIGLVARMVNEVLMTPPKYWGETIGALADEYKKLDEEMRDLLFGKEGEDGKRYMLFANEAERIASFKDYQNDLRIATNTTKDYVIEKVTDIGDKFAEIVEKDFESLKKLMGGLVNILPPGMQTAIDKMVNALKELRNMYKLFQEEPPKMEWGLKLPKGKFVTEETKEFKKQLDEIGETLRGQMKPLSIWLIRWIGGLDAILERTKAWNEGFGEALDGIKASWTSTFTDILNDTYDKARTIENVFEDMFLGILHSFNKILAEVLAHDLWYAMFGRGHELPMGAMTLFHGGKVQKAGDMGFYGREPLRLYEEYQMPSGTEMLQQSRKTIPSVKVTVINQSGTQLSAGKPTIPQLKDKEYIVNVMLEAYDIDPNVRAGLRGR